MAKQVMSGREPRVVAAPSAVLSSSSPSTKATGRTFTVPSRDNHHDDKNNNNMAHPKSPSQRHAYASSPTKVIMQHLCDNPYVLGLTAFASLGGLLFGYDQGVVSGILTMESFAAKFPRIYMDATFKGWFTSTLLLAAWLGSLVNGPIADRLGRKGSILLAVAIFTLGAALQAGAESYPMLFTGRAIAGFPVGMLTMVVPMYISEVSTPAIRGTLVVLQQLSVTIGLLLSYWIDFATQFIGGIKCAPDIPVSGGTIKHPTFDPYNDVGPHGCDGQRDASWRLPLALQILPALVLGLGMLFFPESPRFYCLRHQEQQALRALSVLRQTAIDSPRLGREYLAIKADVLFEAAHARAHHPGKTGASLYAAQYASLFATAPARHRLAVGCTVMFFQQFMGSTAIIYYAPTIFEQLGLTTRTASLLATGVYGLVSTLATLPALILIDRFGRRPLLMAGAFGTCLSLGVVAAMVGVFDHDSDTDSGPVAAGWVGIAFVYLYDINFSYSFAPIGWVLPAEIFNLGHRAKAVSITTSAAWMCNFVVALVTPLMLDRLGWGTYLFFAAFCLLALGFTYFFVPETRGRSLEDMDRVFGDVAAHQEKRRLFDIATELGIADLDTVGSGKVGRMDVEQV